MKANDEEKEHKNSFTLGVQERIIVYLILMEIQTFYKKGMQQFWQELEQSYCSITLLLVNSNKSTN